MIRSKAAGDISLGQLSAGDGGTLGIVTLAAAGGLTTNGTSITAGGLALSAGNGDMTVGNITVTGGILAVDQDGELGVSTNNITLNTGSATTNVGLRATGTFSTARTITMAAAVGPSPARRVGVVHRGCHIRDRT